MAPRLVQMSHAALAIAATGALALGCGAGVPTHSGYKSEKSTPWKKAKVVVLDKNSDAKAHGDVDYAAYHRARWFAIDLHSAGELTFTLDAAPASTGRSDDDEFDLALEVFDPSNRRIAKADADDDDAHEIHKTRTVGIAAAGHYLFQIYLERRTDAADFDLKLHFAPSSGGNPPVVASMPVTPATIAFPPSLPVVPIDDDTPDAEHTKVKHVASTPAASAPHHAHVAVEKPAPADEAPSNLINAHVINVIVSGGNTQITFNRGTDSGVQNGMSGQVLGIKDGSFSVAGCSPRACKGNVKATPDEVNRSGKVIVKP